MCVTTVIFLIFPYLKKNMLLLRIRFITLFNNFIPIILFEHLLTEKHHRNLTKYKTYDYLKWMINQH